MKYKDVVKMSPSELRVEVTLLRGAAERACGHLSHWSLQCIFCDRAHHILDKALIGEEVTE